MLIPDLVEKGVPHGGLFVDMRDTPALLAWKPHQFVRRVPQMIAHGLRRPFGVASQNAARNQFMFRKRVAHDLIHADTLAQLMHEDW
ncbi:hypothetical protein VSR68_14890 [Paraburkholderia phymatum]